MKTYNAVFEGGGAKGIAYAGALKACEEQEAQIDFKAVAGSSAGAITATLVACRYNADQISKLTPAALKKFDSMPRSMAMVGFRSSLLDSTGLHDLIRGKIADAFADQRDRDSSARREEKSPDYTFKQIYDEFGVKLYVVTLDLAVRQPRVFSPDLTPHSPVAAAVVASSAIPVAFPVSRVDIDGNVHRLVDGGTWSNYPSFVFLDDDFRHFHGLGPATEPTIGFVLDDSTHSRRSEPNEPQSPIPAPGVEAVSDHGSSARELGLAGAIVSSSLFRVALAMAPVLFVLLSFRWLQQELNSSNSLIYAAPVALQDLIVLGSIVLLALTGLVAVVLAFIVVRLGRSLFDTGMVGAVAAMGVGPGVPYWVGSRSATASVASVREVPLEAEEVRTTDDQHIAVRIETPTELKTLNFDPGPALIEAAQRRGKMATETALERAKGPTARTPGHDPETDESTGAGPGREETATARYEGETSRFSQIGSSTPLRFSATTYALGVGSVAAFQAMLAFGRDSWWHAIQWSGVVSTAVVAGVWLLAVLRRAEATEELPYRHLGKVESPFLANAAAASAAILAVAIACWSLWLNSNSSLFATLETEPFEGTLIDQPIFDEAGEDRSRMDCDQVEAANAIVVFDYGPAFWGDGQDATRLKFREIEGANLRDLAGRGVPYCHDIPMGEDVSEDIGAISVGLESVPEPTPCDSSTVEPPCITMMFNIEGELAFVKDDPKSTPQGRYGSLALLTLSFAFLLLGARARRAAKWVDARHHASDR